MTSDEVKRVQTHALLGFGLSEGDLDRADAFLDVLFPGTGFCNFLHQSPIQLLERIVSDFLNATTPEKVVLPLTAGYDSRAILGALIRYYPAERIHCVTVGEIRNVEVLGAAQACETLGLKHTVINPNEHLWNANQCVQRTRRVFRDHGVYGTMYGPLFDSMGTICAEDNKLFLSGFLGDAITGAHLRSGAFDPDKGAIEAFLKMNAVYSCDFGYQRSILKKFVERWEKRLYLRGYSGITSFDILDLGLRQALRICGVAKIRRSRVFSPFMCPDYVAFWYHSAGIKQRLGQCLYVKELHRHYPEIFGSPLSSRKKLAKRIVKRLKRMWGQPAMASERGTLASNRTKLPFLLDHLESFAKRHVSLPWDVYQMRAALQMSSPNPSNDIMKVVIATASTEINVRAGNFLQE